MVFLFNRSIISKREAKKQSRPVRKCEALATEHRAVLAKMTAPEGGTVW